MKVFEPLRRYSSPSRRAVDAIWPNASEPEFGSVIAHAPSLSGVGRSRTQRLRCAIVPFELIAADVSPTDTPSDVTIPGEHLQSSMIGNKVNPLPRDSSPSAGFSPFAPPFGASPLAAASS